MNALTTINRKTTAQTVKAKKGQKPNNAGGFSFKVDDTARLERFMVLGTDGGTYYVSEKTLTADAMKFLTKMVKKDAQLVADVAVNVSVTGRAYRNSPAIFAAAVLMVDGDDKALARYAFNKIVRTSTHLFEYMQYIENLGGWGRAKRNAVASWYEKDADKLAYQLVKYRQRNQWTHRDALRLSHPKNVDAASAAFALRGEVLEEAPDIIHGYDAMTKVTSVNGVLSVLDGYPDLPWETVPTQYLNSPEVWKQLFANGQLRGQNAIRNVGRLNKIGAFNDMVFAREFANVITDPDNIKASRLHPINYLNAICANRAYSYYGPKATSLKPIINDALNDGFHAAFEYVEPANKRTLLGLDVSGSMSWSACNGLAATPAEAGAAMAMTFARTEPYYDIMGFSTKFVDLGISPSMNLDQVMAKTSRQSFGGTDCSLPMEWALKNRVEIDTFVTITDSETYAGRQHPFQALKKYRDATGIPARMAVIGMTSTGFTIADPKDNGSLDVVGFDTSAPRVLTDFSAGRL